MGRYARKAVAFLVVVAGLAMLATPALAEKPVVLYDADEIWEGTSADFDRWYCDFEAYYRQEHTIRITEFYDNDGNPSLTVHVHGTAYIMKEEGGDVVVTEHFAVTDTVEFALVEGSEEPIFVGEIMVGNNWSAHAGAGGILVNQSGKIVFDENGEIVEVHGPYPVGAEDFADYCEAIAG